MEAHVCRNGYIRKYPQVLCSMCKPNIPAVHLDVDESRIDEINEETKQRAKQGACDGIDNIKE